MAAIELDPFKFSFASVSPPLSKTTMKHFSGIFISLLALASLPAAADPTQSGSPWRTYASVGYTNGGDVLISGKYRDTQRPYTLRAGKGLQVMAGALYRFDSDWSVQAAVGYHRDKTNGQDGDFQFSRWPVHVAVFRSLGNDWRVGLGAYHSLGAKLKSYGVVAPYGNWSLKSSPAPMLEVQYLFQPLSATGGTPVGGVSFRFVDERFEIPAARDIERDGRHLAISLFSYF